MMPAVAVCLGLGGMATPACSNDTQVGSSNATELVFDMAAPLEGATFFDAPFPSDARRVGGAPDVAGYPVAVNAEKLLAPIRAIAGERGGFPVIPVAYFRFTAALKPRALNDATGNIEGLAASTDSVVWMVDLGSGPEGGTLVPTVASTLVEDATVPPNLFAVSPYPGFILRPNTPYGVVVTTQLTDEQGRRVRASSTLGRMLRNGASPGSFAGEGRERSYAETLQPLARFLEQRKIAPDSIAAATVFTTGDVVADTFTLTEAVLKAHRVQLEELRVDPDDGAKHKDYCEVVGAVSFPQFQRGTPPFNTEGLFTWPSGDRLAAPVEQRRERATLTVSIPKGRMPAKGFPLVIYFHGSGGIGAQWVDASKTTDKNQPDGPKGEGPSATLAPFGIAGAATSLPISPERVPGASDIDYLNLSNLAAMRDTFRQGVIEQRLLLAALRTVEIPKSALTACTGLDADVETFRFDPELLFAMGQSMGGMYTNFMSAVEPRIKAAVPTGAGGYWTRFILDSDLIPNAGGLIGILVGASGKLTYHHPTLNLLETAWETVDPIVYTSRVGHRPLPGHPTRHIYEPAGRGDRYFPVTTFDAMALAYNNQQAGMSMWPSMQQSLAQRNAQGLLPYPAANNRTSEQGVPYTGVVVQYEGDGIADPHAIYRQLDAVKHQYSCFLDGLVRGQPATVVAPATVGTPCR
jgi:hypothetical protein